MASCLARLHICCPRAAHPDALRCSDPCGRVRRSVCSVRSFALLRLLLEPLTTDTLELLLGLRLIHELSRLFVPLRPASLTGELRLEL